MPSAVEGTHSLAAGFQGETSGQNDGAAAGSTYGFGETAAVGFPQPGAASAAAGSHHASRAEPAAPQGAAHAKRKVSEMGEVGDQTSPPGRAAAAAEEVQECDMQPAEAGGAAQRPGVSSMESEGEGAGAAAEFNR